MTERLFNRQAILQIDRLKINRDTLDFEFDVPFDNDLEPNESVISVFNLSDDSVNRIKRGQQVSINCGYKGDTGVILSGYVSRVQTKPTGADQETVLYVLDSQPLDVMDELQRSYNPGVKASTIINDLIALLKLKVAVLKLPQNITYEKGYVINGNVPEELRKVAKDCGAIVYINKSQTYIRALNDGDDARFTLSADTGLIGSPEPFEEEEDGVIVTGYKVRCLLQHRITTASIIKLKSKYVSGTFRVRNGSHKWSGSDFITTMEVIA